MNKQSFQSYFELDLIGMATISHEKNWLEFNQSLCDMFGYTREEFAELTWAELTYPEDLDDELMQFNQVLAGKINGYSLEKRFIRRDGEILFTEFSTRTIRKADGSVDYFIALIQNTTEHKQADEALQRSLEIYQHLYDSSPAMLVSVDVKTASIIRCNETLARKLGHTKEEITGRSIFEFYTAESAEYARKNVLPVFIKTGVIRDEELQVQRKDGTILDVLLNVLPIRDQQGTIVRSYSSWHDITARKKAERALKKAHNELQDQNRKLKNEIKKRRQYETALEKSSERIKLFAYSVAHDLKSPSIAIHGLAQLLNRRSKDILPEKELKFCEQIMKSSEQIAALVDKINIYTSTQEAPLKLEQVKLTDIIRMIGEEFGQRLNDRQIKWSNPAYLPTIKADKIALLRVLRNLVENALKYGGNELHEIVINYRKSPDFHILSVSNDGTRIANEDCKNIFQLSGRTTTSSRTGGTGLGLAIVKEIAEQHKGKVWAETGSDKGVIISVALAKDL